MSELVLNKGNGMTNNREKAREKVNRLENRQETIISYVSSIGKRFMYLLPPVLVIITVFLFLDGVTFLLRLSFFTLLGLYGINATFLLIGAKFTERSLNARLQFERKRGRPIESLDGFETLSNGVNRVILLLKIVSLLCYISLSLYLIMLTIGELEIGIAAAGFTLVGFGIAVLIRSLNLKLNDINGLQDFYKPSMHTIMLDNFMTDIVSNHLDPITFLKWDDFLTTLQDILAPSFIEKIHKQEKKENPLTFAIEKKLFLYYLLHQDILSKKEFEQELSEVVDFEVLDSLIKKGLEIEGRNYFNNKDIFQIFDYIRKYNPAFFKIVDRLQLELRENIQRLAEKSLYLDTSTEEVVYRDGELNIMTFIYNNTSDAKEYTVEVVAPGFEPENISIQTEVEGKGKFTIPSERLSLIDSEQRGGVERKDIVGVISSILENGDALWLTLEPQDVGEKTIQIFLRNPDGTIVAGETKTVEISKNTMAKFKKVTSVGSLLGGILAPIARLLFLTGMGFPI